VFLFPEKFSRVVFFSLSVLLIMPLFHFYDFTVDPIRIVSKGKQRLEYYESKQRHVYILNINTKYITQRLIETTFLFIVVL